MKSAWGDEACGNKKKHGEGDKVIGQNATLTALRGALKALGGRYWQVV